MARRSYLSNEIPANSAIQSHIMAHQGRLKRLASDEGAPFSSYEAQVCRIVQALGVTESTHTEDAVNRVKAVVYNAILDDANLGTTLHFAVRQLRN